MMMIFIGAETLVTQLVYVMIPQLMTWRDVKKAALAKYKSEEGLEAEFEKRKLAVYFPCPPAKHTSDCPAACSHTRALPTSIKFLLPDLVLICLRILSVGEEKVL